MNRRLLLLTILGLSVALACDRTPPLTNGLGSADELAGAVLDALARNDRARLEQLALSEQEFRDHVWPDLPASRPERNLPFSYVWGDLHQKSLLSLSTVLGEHGGKRYQLKRVSFGGEESRYGRARVRREAVFHVMDPSGNEIELRVCGSLVEHDGVWKVFSYVFRD